MDTLKNSSKDMNSRLHQIISETEKIKKRLDSLQDKFIDNEIGKEDYHQMKAKYVSEIEKLTREKSEINLMTNDISDQLEFCMGILENLSGFYEKTDVVGKQQIIGSIFTGNLIFSKNKVRTTKVNEVVSLLVNSSKAFEKKKKGQLNKNLKLSPWVTPEGLLAGARDPQ